MNCRKRGKAPNPNAHKKKEPSRKAGDKRTYGDKHGMERRQRDPDPDWEGSGKAVKWS